MQNKIFVTLKYGSEKEFEMVFKEYYPRLCSFAYNYMGDYEKSEDIVQDFFSNLWSKRHTIKVNGSVNSFFYQSIKNRCLNHNRNEAREQKKIQEYQVSDMNYTDEHNYIKEEIYANLHKAISQLPPKSRDVLLSSMSDMSNIEICDDMNISLNTVKTNKKRAYKKLREYFSAKNIH